MPKHGRLVRTLSQLPAHTVPTIDLKDYMKFASVLRRFA